MERSTSKPRVESGIPLILLSGMGADHRVFAAQKAVFASLVVPEWDFPTLNESLDGYARRFAEAIVQIPAPGSQHPAPAWKSSYHSFRGSASL